MSSMWSLGPRCHSLPIFLHLFAYCPTPLLLLLVPHNPGLTPPKLPPLIPPPGSWDTGASHHVTGDLCNLSIYDSLSGADFVPLGDGTGLPFSHTGSASLTSSLSPLALHNVLRVLLFHKNLISVHKLCVDNHISVLFTPSLFQVRDLHTGALLKTGSPRDGLHEWRGDIPSSPSIQALTIIPTSMTQWHSRLGHPTSNSARVSVPTLIQQFEQLPSTALSNSHPMITRSKNNISLPNKKYCLSTSALPSSA